MPKLNKLKIKKSVDVISKNNTIIRELPKQIKPLNKINIPSYLRFKVLEDIRLKTLCRNKKILINFDNNKINTYKFVQYPNKFIVISDEEKTQIIRYCNYIATDILKNDSIFRIFRYYNNNIDNINNKIESRNLKIEELIKNIAYLDKDQSIEFEGVHYGNNNI